MNSLRTLPRLFVLEKLDSASTLLFPLVTVFIKSVELCLQIEDGIFLFFTGDNDDLLEPPHRLFCARDRRHSTLKGSWEGKNAETVAPPCNSPNPPTYLPSLSHVSRRKSSAAPEPSY
ncbi:hypothetical protein ACFXTN_041286 [Malus domestica]